MYVNLEKKAVFLCHPRTASQSSSRFLCEAAGFTRYNRIAHEYLPFKTRGVHAGHHEQLATAPPEGWRVACTVRDHVEVVLSWLWHSKKKTAVMEKKVNIHDYLKTLHMPDQIGANYYPKQGSLLPNLEFATDVFRYQRPMYPVIREWAESLGVEVPKEHSFNDKLGESKGLDRDWEMWPEWRQAIEEIYGDEMRAWGFLPAG